MLSASLNKTFPSLNIHSIVPLNGKMGHKYCNMLLLVDVTLGGMGALQQLLQFICESKASNSLT